MFGRRPSLLGRLALVTGFLTFLVPLGLSWLQSSTQPSRNLGTSGRGPSITFEDFLRNPIEAGAKLSLDEASDKSAFPIWLPSHRLANRDSVEGVWVSGHEVALTFASDLVIIEEFPQFPDSSEEFIGLLAHPLSLKGIDARVELIKGQTALVIEPNTDSLGTNPGSLQVVNGDLSPSDHDGVSITLYGENVSGAALIEIAETLTVLNESST